MNTHTNKKGFSSFFALVAVAIIAIIAVVGFVLLKKPSGYGIDTSGYPAITPNPASTIEMQSVAPVATLSPDSDTQTIEKELNSTQVNSVDADINQMNSAASSL